MLLGCQMLEKLFYKISVTKFVTLWRTKIQINFLKTKQVKIVICRGGKPLEGFWQSNMFLFYNQLIKLSERFINLKSNCFVSL